jgi:hypothetical protein
MKATARRLLALGLLMALPMAAQGGSNLLLNPGAETGTTSGWTVDNPMFGGTSNPGVDNGSFDPGINPHSGSYIYSIGAWENITETHTIPVGTRSIDYVM